MQAWPPGVIQDYTQPAYNLIQQRNGFGVYITEALQADGTAAFSRALRVCSSQLPDKCGSKIKIVINPSRPDV